jgi:hypothetical protein
MLQLGTTAFSHASKCLKAYYYSQVCKLVKKPADISPRMRKGIWLHKCLQEYHSGRDWEVALGELVTWVLDRHVPEEAVAKMEAEVRRLFEQYLAYWAPREVPWKVLVSEKEYYIDLPGDVRISATLDAVIEDHRGQWVVEHKSTSDIPDQQWRGADPQTAIQFFLADRSGEFPDLRGIIFNYLLTDDPAIPEVTKGNKKEPPRIGAKVKSTTTASFEKAKNILVPAMAKWQKENAGGEDYAAIAKHVDEKRAEIVMDGKWFQRYEVFRPTENVLETMRDVALTVKAVKEAMQTGRWRRSFHIITCRKFCTYSDLCMQEYLLGRESQALREGLFILDDGKREGR